MVISNTRELEKLKDRIPNLINIAPASPSFFR